MAPVSATLDINFISNYAGEHRICYRIPPAVAYDCTNSVICTGGGAVCSICIPILVDNESCNPVTYEGYVQAACQNISSVVDRIPFSITFVPNPTCDSYRVTCDNVGVASVVIDFPSSGYDFLNPPSAIISGGGGSGATTSVVIGSTINITNPGTGYVDGSYINVPVVNVVGSGIGALASVTVAGGVITAVAITNNGNSCYFGPAPFGPNTFTFNNADLGGGVGTNFQAAFSATYGSVISVIVTSPGSGYTSIPTITFDPTLCGSPVALADAKLAGCPNQILGTTCNGSPSPSITGMKLGQSARACMTNLPTILPEYTFVPEGCCYDCVNVCFSVGPVSADIYYTDCSTNLLTVVNLGPGGSTGLLNVVNNSWYWSPSNAGVTVSFGACP